MDHLFGDPSLGRDATYTHSGGAISIRVVPLTAQRDFVTGAAPAAMLREGRSFLALRSAFGAVDPRTGDTIMVDGATWRVRTIEERSIQAGVWVLGCQP